MTPCSNCKKNKTYEQFQKKGTHEDCGKTGHMRNTGKAGHMRNVGGEPFRLNCEDSALALPLSILCLWSRSGPPHLSISWLMALAPAQSFLCPLTRWTPIARVPERVARRAPKSRRGQKKRNKYKSALPKKKTGPPTHSTKKIAHPTKKIAHSTKKISHSTKKISRSRSSSDPCSCIFFDDNPKNIAAAKQLGGPDFLYFWLAAKVNLFFVQYPEADDRIAQIHDMPTAVPEWFLPPDVPLSLRPFGERILLCTIVARKVC